MYSWTKAGKYSNSQCFQVVNIDNSIQGILFILSTKAILNFKKSFHHCFFNYKVNSLFEVIMSTQVSRQDSSIFIAMIYFRNLSYKSKEIFPETFSSADITASCWFMERKNRLLLTVTIESVTITIKFLNVESDKYLFHFITHGYYW